MRPLHRPQLAQIAYAARLAGHEPPGEHDFFYAPETEAMD